MAAVKCCMHLREDCANTSRISFLSVPVLHEYSLPIKNRCGCVKREGCGEGEKPCILSLMIKAQKKSWFVLSRHQLNLDFNSGISASHTV